MSALIMFKVKYIQKNIHIHTHLVITNRYQHFFIVQFKYKDTNTKTDFFFLIQADQKHAGMWSNFGTWWISK